MTLDTGLASATENFNRIGLNLFFDATYVEVNVDLIFGSPFVFMGLWSNYMDTTDLVLGIVGKYPFTITDGMQIFPFVGIDYNLNLSAEYKGKEADFGDENKADYLSHLSLLFGVGVDYNFTDAMYLRGEVGFGLTFNNKGEKDTVDLFSALTGKDAGITQYKLPYKVAVGFRF